MTVEQPDTDDLRIARVIYDAVNEGYDVRRWDDLPSHRRVRYITAAMAAARELIREPGARVIAFRAIERIGHG